MRAYARTILRVSKHLLPLAFAAGLAACSTTPNPVPAGTDTAWYGNLGQGGKFGTAVGLLAANAPEALWAQGYGYEGMVACSSETRDLLGCHPNEQYLSFQPVEIGRKGHVYLKVENDRVSQIAWAFTVVPYLDN